MINKIARAEAKGENAEDLRQVLFTEGVDYPDIDRAVKAAGRRKPDVPPAKTERAKKNEKKKTHK